MIKYIALTLLAVVIGCSTVDEDKKLNEIGITRPESKNFLKAVIALDASCKRSDSNSIEACQFFKQQSKSVLDMDQFVKTSLSNPDLLTDADRSIFDNITLTGASYRDYIQGKRGNADGERFWNWLAAGAGIGTLFSRPTPPPQTNCQAINANTPSPLAQCQ